MERPARDRPARTSGAHAVRALIDELRIWLGAVLMDWTISILPPIPQTKAAVFLIDEAAKSILHAYGAD